MGQYKPVQRILNQGGDNLRPLLERAHYLQTLTDHLRRQLDADLADHLHVANLRGHTAVICADTSAWLARVRYLAPQLLQFLQQCPGLEQLKEIQFRVQPVDTDPAPGTARQVQLSSASAEVIRSTAKGIADPALAAALERLGRRGGSGEEPR